MNAPTKAELGYMVIALVVAACAPFVVAVLS